MKEKIEIETLLKESERKRAELNSQFIAAQKEIEDLNEKIKFCELPVEVKGGDNREIKLKINEIVREVDRIAPTKSVRISERSINKSEYS